MLIVLIKRMSLANISLPLKNETILSEPTKSYFWASGKEQDPDCETWWIL